MRVLDRRLPAQVDGAGDEASGSRERPKLSTGIQPLAPVVSPLGKPRTESLSETTMKAVGVLRRSGGPEGTKPLLTRTTRARLVEILAQSAPATLSWIDARLSAIPTAVGRGILLRALAARVEPGPVGWAELDAFASRLAGMSDVEILAHSTVLDLDSRVNSSTLDIAKTSNKVGTVHAPKPDASSDNDGLFQKFTASCGPTVLQMMICEADPLQAFAVNDQGLTSASAHDSAAEFQKKLLEKYGGVAIGRRLAFTRARLNNGLGQLQKLGKLSLKDKASFVAMTQGQVKRSKPHREILDRLRERYHGFPSDADLKRLRDSAAVPSKDEGIDTEALGDALEVYVTPLVGVTYTPTKLFARGQAWRYLDAVEGSLRRGIDVPFGISEPGHWMLMTHVRGKKPNRRFLVSDPEGGRTAWVGEKALRNGSFGREPFELCTKSERSYVDVFFLPD